MLNGIKSCRIPENRCWQNIRDRKSRMDIRSSRWKKSRRCRWYFWYSLYRSTNGGTSGFREQSKSGCIRKQRKNICQQWELMNQEESMLFIDKTQPQMIPSEVYIFQDQQTAVRHLRTLRSEINLNTDLRNCRRKYTIRRRLVLGITSAL